MIIRLFHPDTLTPCSEITLTDNAHRHLTTVLRAQVNQKITLFNNQGGEFTATIENITRKQTQVFIHEHLPIEHESPLYTHLAQVISRGKKMDLTIQKATELGVNEITPLVSERCGVKLKAERSQQKQQHWQQVIISACEQCGRNTLPILHEALSLSEWLQIKTTDTTKLFLHPSATTHLSAVTAPIASLSFTIGSESGFSNQEVSLALANRFMIVSLGNRVLRTETAALALLSIAQYQWGDFCI